MSVTFDESPMVITGRPTRTGGLIGCMLRYHIATTVAGAQKALLVSALCILVLTGYIIRSSVTSSSVDAGKNLVPAINR